MKPCARPRARESSVALENSVAKSGVAIPEKVFMNMVANSLCCMLLKRILILVHVDVFSDRMITTRLTRGARPALGRVSERVVDMPSLRSRRQALVLTASHVCYNPPICYKWGNGSTPSREGIVTVPVSDS